MILKQNKIYKSLHRQKIDHARYIFATLVTESLDPIDPIDPIEVAKKTGCDWLIKAIQDTMELRAYHNECKESGLIKPETPLPGVYMESWRGGISPRTLRIEVELEYYPDTTWSSIKDKVIAEAKRQYDTARDEFRSELGITPRDKYPTKLERDVTFVFQRKVLEWSDIKIWNKWSEDYPKEDLTYETVREIISDTAKVLGVTL